MSCLYEYSMLIIAWTPDEILCPIENCHSSLVNCVLCDIVSHRIMSGFGVQTVRLWIMSGFDVQTVRLCHIICDYRVMCIIFMRISHS